MLRSPCLIEPSLMKTIFFIRHGRTEWNAIRRMQGQWNSNLDDLGREQADVNGRWLADVGIEALFASPLDRTRQTAEIINKYLNLPITYDDRLKEWDCGDWSGWLYAEIENKWPEEWTAWRADGFNYRAPNAENYPDMMARSAPFLDELCTQEAHTLAVVSHGMIGKAMMATLLGLSAQETLAFHQPNDRVFRIEIEASGARSASYFDRGEGPKPGLQEVSAAADGVA